MPTLLRAPTPVTRPRYAAGPFTFSDEIAAPLPDGYTEAGAASEITFPAGTWLTTTGALQAASVAGNSPARAHAVCRTAYADVRIRATLTPKTSGASSVLVRYIDKDNHYLVLLDHAGSKISVYVLVGNVLTLLASATVTLVIGTAYPVVVTVRGTTITGTVNGVTVTYPSATIGRNVTAHGLRAFAAAERFDAFAIETIADALFAYDRDEPVAGTRLGDNGAGIDLVGYTYHNPFARLVVVTSATRGALEVHSSLYAAYPTRTPISIRVNGAHYTTVNVDGDHRRYVPFGLPSGRDKVVEFVMPGQDRTSTQGVLAFVQGVYVRRLMLNDTWAYVTPSTSNLLVVYGDSIAAGFMADIPSRDAWTVRWRQARGPSKALRVEAWGSRSLHEDASTAPLRAALVARLTAGSPATIWLAIGTNDYGQAGNWSAANFGTAYAALLDDLHAALPGAAIYCQTPLVRASPFTEAANSYGDTLGAYRTQIATAVAARTAYATLVDGTAILTSGQLYDGVHPSPAGHLAYQTYVTTNYPSL